MPMLHPKLCSPGFSLSHPIRNFSACHFPYCDSYSKSVMSLLLCCCHSYNYCPFIFIALHLLFMHRDCFFCTLSIFLLIHFHLFHPFFMCPFYCSHCARSTVLIGVDLTELSNSFLFLSFHTCHKIFAVRPICSFPSSLVLASEILSHHLLKSPC